MLIVILHNKRLTAFSLFQIEYLVAWTGYPEQYNQWVLEQNVTTDLKRAFSLGMFIGNCVYKSF